MTYDSRPCPKCNRTLRPSGVLTIGDVEMPTYQCDECLETKRFGNESFEVALTFAVDPSGAVLPTGSFAAE